MSNGRSGDDGIHDRVVLSLENAGLNLNRDINNAGVTIALRGRLEIRILGCLALKLTTQKQQQHGQQRRGGAGWS